MSRLLSAESMGAAETIGIGALGSAASGGGIFHARFADGQSVPRFGGGVMSGGRSQGSADPVEQARADGFAAGFDEGMRVATESFALDADAMQRLGHALDQLAPAANGALSALLSAAVHRLVAQIVGETPVDVELLARRVEAVAAFIEDTQARTALHVHPDDIALLQGREFGFPLTPDASLGRGSVRLDTADGWIEDGPDVQISRLKAMLDDMEGRS